MCSSSTACADRQPRRDLDLTEMVTGPVLPGEDRGTQCGESPFPEGGTVQARQGWQSTFGVCGGTARRFYRIQADCR
jgi:hypothetical protein